MSANEKELRGLAIYVNLQKTEEIIHDTIV